MHLTVHKRADLLPAQDAADVHRVLQRKDENRQIVVHGQTGGGGIHHLQAPRQDILIADLIKLHRGRVLTRVGRVDAVNIFGQQDGIRTDLGGTPSSATSRR